MPQRMIRLNKIVYRELNSLLHTAFRDVAGKIVATEVLISPDLRDAYVYFSVTGGEDDVRMATKFLLKNSKILRRKLFQRVRLKHSPRLNFRHDNSLARAQRVIELLDSL
jgi:ribosome-binding factor A